MLRDVDTHRQATLKNLAGFEKVNSGQRIERTKKCNKIVSNLADCFDWNKRLAAALSSATQVDRWQLRGGAVLHLQQASLDRAEASSHICGSQFRSRPGSLAVYSLIP